MTAFLKYILIIVSISFISNPIDAQNSKYLDSLKQELLVSKNLIVKAELHNLISKDFIYKDYDQALKHTDTMMLLSQKTGNEEFIMAANYNYSIIYRGKGDYEKALTFQNIYSDYIEQKGDTLKIAMAYYQLGAINLRLDRNEVASEALIKALSYAEGIENNSLSFKILNALGVLYKNISQHDKALEYYNKAVDYCKIEKDTASLAVIYNGLGVLYTKMDSSSKALVYFEEALGIAKKSGNIAAIGHHNRNIGTILFEQGDYKSAEEYHLKALDIRLKVKSKLPIGGTYSDLGEVYMATGRLSKAEEYFENALSIFKELKALISENYIYDKLSVLHAKRKNYERSNYYLNKYYSTRDSLQNNELREKINELDIKYETVKKDSEIATHQLQLTERTSQRNLFMIGAGTLLFLTWFLFYRNRKNALLATSKIENLKKQQKLMALDYMVQGQEEERKRIAQDLHDGLGGILASARLQMQKIQGEIEKFTDMNLFNQAEQLIDNAHQEVRRISHDMMPGALIDLGFIDAVGDLVEKIRMDHSFTINFSIPSQDVNLTEPQSVNLYRIVQEIFSNIIKHAEANTVDLLIQLENEKLMLTVSDNGKGFDYDQAKKHDGLGLNSIESRVSYLGGNVNVVTSDGKGTSYQIEITIGSESNS